MKKYYIYFLIIVALCMPAYGDWGEVGDVYYRDGVLGNWNWHAGLYYGYDFDNMEHTVLESPGGSELVGIYSHDHFVGNNNWVADKVYPFQIFKTSSFEAVILSPFSPIFGS